MNSPLDENQAQQNDAVNLGVLSERLEEMSPSELAEAMEQALNAMTEETYDPGVIDAYLNALDKKSPIPQHPSAEEAYRNLQKKVVPLAGVGGNEEKKESGRSRASTKRILRNCLVAALVTGCLFGSVVFAQASGVDVLGALARWSESTFGFGRLPTDNRKNSSVSSDTVSRTKTVSSRAEVSEEYQELQTTLDGEGLSVQILTAPETFYTEDSALYVDNDTGNIDFCVTYTNGADLIVYSITQNDSREREVYEKDAADVTKYEQNGVLYYLFENNDAKVAAWVKDGFEYSISVVSDSVSPIDLIKSNF
ncbi:DUF4367 domain-containing protein [Lawsonibacter sp. DFI.6.74]|nr:DUF4367 domain-containing protein [Lawsonibacter sp. DFI.6.74]MCG4773942.1 DUF4367 domain-containing protein [Lawsonibacter sp. DFI.5.51]